MGKREKPSLKIRNRSVYFGTLTVVSVLFAAGAFYTIMKKQSSQNDRPPAKTVEQLLKEREANALAHLATPLGTLFANRDWDAFSKAYQPEKDSIELAEMIRASFLQDGMKSFKSDDQEHLMEIVVRTLGIYSPKTVQLLNPLLFQAERLPTPDRASKNYRAFEKWLSDPNANARLKKLALIKLVMNAEQPDAKWVSVVGSGINGNRFGIDFKEWLQLIAETRNVKTRQQLMGQLFRAYSGLKSEQRPAALILMSSYPEVSTASVKSAAFQLLKSKKYEEYEAGLRSVGSLLHKKLITADEKMEIKKLLTQTPIELNTPYVSTKTREILNEF